MKRKQYRNEDEIKAALDVYIKIGISSPEDVLFALDTLGWAHSPVRPSLRLFPKEDEPNTQFIGSGLPRPRAWWKIWVFKSIWRIEFKFFEGRLENYTIKIEWQAL